MDRAVSSWLIETNICIASSSGLTKKLNKSYTIYGTMLLLPPSAFEGPEWESIRSQLNVAILTTLYESICKHLQVTHIAINNPIPLHNQAGEKTSNFNVLRSPSNFQPLHGNFGAITAADPPTAEDFSKAFWVTAKQNGIYQTWAPNWTMFSRGNISEKARLLTLGSVLSAVEEGPCTAVDLYAGIGYFAFSYVKAGVRQVLCWDLNPWSCEGLRRGARKNKWEVEMVCDCVDVNLEGSEARLVVFNESNESAPKRVAKLRGGLPPVRHVNCGMLPSSRESLQLAAGVLDREYDGWVHIHENFLVEEISRKAEETRVELLSILDRVRGIKGRAELECVNRLKSYAPGVMHCVVDIFVHGGSPT